jgi:two-component sensor histidine kinase
VPKGHVDINWRRLPPAEGDGIEMLWTESGGPKVAKPEQRGFGSLVIEQNLARSIDSDVDLSFPPDGLRCRVLIPPSQLSLPG